MQKTALKNQNFIIVRHSECQTLFAGMPEGRLPLVNSIIYVCEASKSNSVVNALDKAVELVNKSKDDNVPMYLRDANFKLEKVEGSQQSKHFLCPLNSTF